MAVLMWHAYHRALAGEAPMVARDGAHAQVQQTSSLGRAVLVGRRRRDLAN